MSSPLRSFPAVGRDSAPPSRLAGRRSRRCGRCKSRHSAVLYPETGGRSRAGGPSRTRTEPRPGRVPSSSRCASPWCVVCRRNFASFKMEECPRGTCCRRRGRGIAGWSGNAQSPCATGRGFPIAARRKDDADVHHDVDETALRRDERAPGTCPLVEAVAHRRAGGDHDVVQPIAGQVEPALVRSTRRRSRGGAPRGRACAPRARANSARRD